MTSQNAEANQGQGAQRPPGDGNKSISAETVERLWQWQLHEDTLFHSRAELFLLAETMLLATFAAAVWSENPNPIVRHISGTIGITVSALWLIVSWKQIVSTIGPIKERIKNSKSSSDFIKEYMLIVESRSKGLSGFLPSSSNAIGVYTPILFGAFWLYLAKVT